MEKALYDTYLAILKEELVPAMGCTEPIAVAYAAALAARALGCPAEQAEVAASANIIKNVKSVVVPHTGGRRGIAAAAAAGIVAGDADKELEVLCAVTEDDLKKMADFLEKTPIHVERSGKPYLFDIQVRLFGGGHTAFAEIAGHHTNVIALQRDGEVLLQKEYVEQTSTQATDHTLLNVEQIVQFADEADLNDVKETLQRQIDCNTAIAKQGLEGHWGAEIGRILRDGEELLFIEVEVSRFPVVDQDRPLAVLPVTADQVIVEEIVEGAAHIAEAVGRVDEERLGSSEALAGSEDPLEGAFVDADPAARCRSGRAAG